MGTADGLSLYDHATSHFTLQHSSQEDKSSLAGLLVNELYQAKDGKIWVATNNGAAWLTVAGAYKRIESDGSKSDKLSHVSIVNIAQPHDDEIWLATYGGGINVLDAVSGKVISQIKHDVSVPSGINHDAFGALLLDRSGLLWLGTWGNGLNYYNTNNAAFSTLRHSPSNDNSLRYPDVLSVMEVDNGDIWVGARSRGIDVFRPGVGRVNELPIDNSKPFSLKDGSISAFLQTKNGTIWVGSRQTGLYRYRPETNDFTNYTDKDGLSDRVIKRLLEDKKGRIIIGTEFSLERFTPKTGFFEHLVTENLGREIIQAQFNALVTLNDGSLAAGSSNGLYILKPNAQYLTKISHNPNRGDSLSHNTVLGLFVNKNGDLFVATEQGLDRLLELDGENSRFESVNSEFGYPGQAFWANMQFDRKGRVWDGVSVLDLENKERYMLTKADGVDIGVNWYGGHTKTNNGTLLYAGSKGLLMIQPERFTKWKHQPNLVITQLMVNGKQRSFSKNDGLVFNPSMKSFSLEFSSLDFSEPEKNRYAYKLDGYDPDWNFISAENRVASYTNLSPGDYRLHIKGSNRLGVWSENQIQLAISIMPKWYQTVGFRVLIFLLLSAFLYLMYFVRVNQLKKHKQELREEVAVRTKELQLSNQSMSTLSDISNEISSTLDLNKILNTVYYHVNQMMDATVFCIGFFDREKDAIRFQLTIERGKQLPEFVVPMNEKERLAVYCVETSSPVVINDFETDKQKYIEHSTYVAPKSGEETESVIYWPLILGGKTIGAISVQSFKKNAYSKHHQKIIRTLASTAAIALDNANAYRRAQQAAEIKSTFLANMSHEIRTPMHGILGLTKLLSKTRLDTEQKEYVKNITISADTLLTVINDILDFSKIEAGKMELEEKPFGLTKLLNNMSVVVDTIAEGKGLTFEYEIQDGTPGDLVGDAPRINQILLNLCSNAVKFTSKGKIQVKISSDIVDQNYCDLRISVIDEGIGIAKEAIPKLFNSFSQADTSTTRKFGGTGLGLAISRLLARKMDGDITVKSKPERGSDFTLNIRLPIFDKLSADYSDKVKLERSKNVLLLDRNESSNVALTRQLVALGAKVFIAHSQAELIEIISATSEIFDSALLSWDEIPEKNTEVIETLRSRLDLPPQNIVVYSGYKISHIIRQVANYDVETVLQKPLSLLELRHFIANNSNASSGIEEQPNKPLDGLLILVAEDNKINQIIAKKLLVSLGATIDLVENGQEAVEQVDKKKYDIVLMDIQMPVMDGTDATKAIRQREEFNSLPIIAMTANVLEDDVETYLNYGIDDHVSKPINTSDLIEKTLKNIALKIN